MRRLYGSIFCGYTVNLCEVPRIQSKQGVIAAMEIKSTEGYMGECGEIYVPQPSTEDRLGGREQQIVHCPVTEASLTGKKSYGNLEVI